MDETVLRRRYVKNGYTVLHGDLVRHHPLAHRGWVHEHVYACHEKYGSRPACHWCKRQLRWPYEDGDARIVRVDHLDGDMFNNDPNNLVPSCQGCNTRRSGKKAAGVEKEIEKRKASGPGICSGCGREFRHNIAFAGHCRGPCKGSTFTYLERLTTES